MKTIKGLKRTHYCETLTEQDCDQTVTLMGWCQKQRDLGGLIFITLRDRSGLIQLCINEDCEESIRELATQVRSEYVLAVRGVVRKRSSINPNMKTGTIEVLVTELRILSESKTPPFYIEENSDAKESLRLKHRYLDLRRPDLQNNFKIRNKISHIIRNYFYERNFLEIETPMLGKSTPEGARDYLVPSRVMKGHFFALPQSPQLYKQLLMVSGFDRYIQLSRCFRDEDLRADRQPEFTQVDLEMSFVEQEDVFELTEGMLKSVLKGVKDIDIDLPIPRMTYKDAMNRFGSDKPDLRFGMELIDLSDWAQEISFPVFENTLQENGHVGAICVPQGASFTRKQIDAYTELVKTYKAKGLAWFAFGETNRGSILKFLSPEKIEALKIATQAKDQDLIFIVSDKTEISKIALGQLRCAVAKDLDMIDTKDKFLWVTEFPLLEFDAEANRYVAMHHPFTAPMDEDLKYLDSDPSKVRAKAYDIVMNGVELGGGSIRIHDVDIQNKMFSLLGFTKESAWDNFSFLLEAFQYGVPPHGGIALGLDRIVMLLCNVSSLREVIAFPKVQTSGDLMTQAPGLVSEKQLEELSIALANIEENNE